MHRLHRKACAGLYQNNVDNIGGLRSTAEQGRGISLAVGIAISHRLTAGNAHYRTGVNRAREVDTVFGGCYRREVFSWIGLFNEELERTQDRSLTRGWLAGR